MYEKIYIIDLYLSTDQFEILTKLYLHYFFFNQNSTANELETILVCTIDATYSSLFINSLRTSEIFFIHKDLHYPGRGLG
jgi:hypothetical protein